VDNLKWTLFPQKQTWDLPPERARESERERERERGGGQRKAEVHPDAASVTLHALPGSAGWRERGREREGGREGERIRGRVGEREKVLESTEPCHQYIPGLGR